MEVFSGQLAEALGGARIYTPSAVPERTESALAHVGLELPLRAAEPARTLRHTWRTEPYELVISNGLCGWPLALAPVPSPMVEIYHITLAGFARKALQRRSDRFTTERVGGFFDRLAGAGKTVVCVSESVRREVSALYGHRSSVLPNGVDVAQFHRGDRDDAREQLTLPRDARIALYVGRPEYAKGFDRVQELARAMKDVLFVSVSGSAPGPENLRCYTNVPHDRMPLFYTAADVFLLPSRYEGFNLSLLEALACELPVVTSAAAYPFDRAAKPLANVVEPVATDGLAQAAREAMDRGPRMDLRGRIVHEYSMDAFRTRWVDFVRQRVDGAKPDD
ncbi:MAG TPA: glycosyltransferase family 4 protein [Thermoplasmata archaeon]|nr:glycosyltransferase family 4 protein [Thermoplasmata archaeon]